MCIPPPSLLSCRSYIAIAACRWVCLTSTTTEWCSRCLLPGRCVTVTVPIVSWSAAAGCSAGSVGGAGRGLHTQGLLWHVNAAGSNTSMQVQPTIAVVDIGSIQGEQRCQWINGTYDGSLNANTDTEMKGPAVDINRSGGCDLFDTSGFAGRCSKIGLPCCQGQVMHIPCQQEHVQLRSKQPVAMEIC